MPESSGKPGAFSDVQAVGPSAGPDVDAARPAMLPGRINLPLDRGRARQATLHGAFRQQGNLARRDEQAVFVIRLDRLARRGQVYAIDEQIVLLLRGGENGQQGGTAAGRAGALAASTEEAVNPKRVGFFTTYLNTLSMSAGMKCTPGRCQARPSYLSHTHT